ncbi:MAG: trypsin-like serine protease [Ruminococcaceae bacterium]|nr:trypsin-like serine protease [Oscillospiraceae bacterium]
MKSRRVLLSLLVIMAMLLATSLPVFAMNFVAEEVYESVFIVHSEHSLGSGFSIGENCIVTNAHVIVNPDDIVIETYSGNEYDVFVVGIDYEQDIAVLGVDGGAFPYLTIADSSSIQTGDEIYAIGVPKSMSYTLTKGVISAQNREIGGNKYIQIDAAINEGNSGGPLLNDDGLVIGMNTLKISDSEGLGFAISTETLKNCLVSLGLELDGSGNVSGEIKEPTFIKEKKNETKQKNDKSKDDEHPSSAFAVVCVVALISIICNVVLLILLIYQKKKNLNLTYDPRERTDFDIDILG